jgi:DNA polymerase II small subunit
MQETQKATFLKNREVIDFFIKKNILIGPDFIDTLDSLNKEELYEYIKNKEKKKTLLVLNKDIKEAIDNNNDLDLDWFEFDKSRALYEKQKNINIYLKFLDFLNSSNHHRELETLSSDIDIQIVKEYHDTPKKRDVQDFIIYFNNRYEAIKKLLRNRPELTNLTSISRVLKKREREQISIIGMVRDIQMTKNKNLSITVEDTTGLVKVLINKNKPELYEEAKNIVLDEVIGVEGVNSEKIIFVNKIVWPDVPINKELKKSAEECYALFLSDLHIGSNYFLYNEFDKFIKWINGKLGNDKQKEVAKKIKYIFIVGDLIDGCGVYPGQESELIIKDIYKQYGECAKQLSKIPKDKKIIICPGNHDAMRIAEPQPPLYKDFAKPLWALPNVIMVSNPAIVNIGKSKNFTGFNVLMYHGYSFDYFVANVDYLRMNGGYDRPELIMKFLLQKRHLAPTHTSTLYLPDINYDPLVIDLVPDFFVTGHIHKSSVINYKGITLICGSCWQAKTSFQEKVGHHPEPSRVPLVNLQTREIKILKF